MNESQDFEKQKAIIIKIAKESIWNVWSKCHSELHKDNGCKDMGLALAVKGEAIDQVDSLEQKIQEALVK